MTDGTYKQDATFSQLVALVIDSEGGYVNNPHDKGGPTKYGVAWNYNADELHHLFPETFPAKCPATKIEELTLDQAKELYYHKYWLSSGAAGLTSINLAYIHFDTAVNCGTGAAKRFLELLGGNVRTVDGKNGANHGDFRGLMLDYVAQRLRYYTHCPAAQKQEFLEGWVNRVADVVHKALSLV